MTELTRRQFVATAGGSASMGVAGVPAAIEATPRERTVTLWGDGIDLSPGARASLLHSIATRRQLAADTYLLGGEIESFEREWAALLGKEAAVFMPSGTLANHLALRALAGTRRRVIVPEVSHVYNDTGDACQTLSGLTLMPLAPRSSTFTKEDAESVLARTAGGRVAAEVGALLIESPIRRLAGRMFDWNEARRVAAWARERGIGSHLDGARLFIASAYTGIGPADYAAPFDTVYVSLWKYFNAGQGAILAGPRRLLDGRHHVRRMFGGNLAEGWPAAVVARHYMEGFLDRLRAAVRTSEEVFDALARHPRLAIERVPDGTNIALLRLRGVDDPVRVQARLASHDIQMPPASQGGTVALWVNETWARRPAAELVAAFEQALA